MKKLTLNETWTECLKMWKWVADQKRKGDIGGVINNVVFFKRQWLEDNGYCVDNVGSHCFFCEYVDKRDRGCELCPGRKIDQRFACSNSDYDYFNEPILFYKKLKKLNRIRK